jgi:putative ATP-dependent endonuclease of OLD family
VAQIWIGADNVQKGSFAQSLALVISDTTVPFTVPSYIECAIQHACQATAKKL